jgi:hypothetical protein
MRKNAPKDEQLVRFQAEAQELLGLKNSGPVTNPATTQPTS